MKNNIEVRKTYYTNGQLRSETQILNRKFHSIRKEWNEDGSLKSEVQYENGIKNGFDRRFFYNGIIDHETPYVNGKKHGIEKWMYDDKSDVVFHEIPYVNGKKHGIERYRYSTGAVELEITYFDDMASDSEMVFRDDGQVVAMSQNKRDLLQGVKIKFDY